jgi:FkbM family methyltransferase
VIPTIAALASAAERVRRSVPREAMTGALSVGLYGYGFLGRWALPRLKKQGARVVGCYDLDPSLHGRLADGIPVQPPDQLAAAAPDFVFVTARHAVAPVSEWLAGLGVAHVSYDACYVASHFDAFRRVHDQLLADERSREVLRAVLMAMLTGDPAYCAAVCEPDQYFCLPPFRECDREIFVDGGAFDGDSAEQFIAAHGGRFLHIYAFEPGLVQFAALQRRTHDLVERRALEPSRITLVNAALGETEGTAAAASANGQLTSFALAPDDATDAIRVNVVSLDRFLDGARATFIKADVEGMEMALLRGARATILNCRPKLAICVYHYPPDIAEIAGHIASIAPDYRFALRQHAPNLMETVLYCWRP